MKVAMLTVAVTATDLNGPVNSFRQQLQGEYLGRILKIMDPDSATDHDHISRSLAFATVRTWRDKLAARPGADATTNAHTAALLHRIDLALNPG